MPGRKEGKREEAKKEALETQQDLTKNKLSLIILNFYFAGNGECQLPSAFFVATQKGKKKNTLNSAVWGI